VEEVGGEEAMKWTTEKPTEPGWYWWQHVPASPYQELSRPIVGLVGMDAIFHNHRYRKAMVDMPSGKWAGPLQLPEEA
jgi:hypothetical protein